jgi:hypothetical protein
MGKFDAAIKRLALSVEVADQAYADGGEFKELAAHVKSIHVLPVTVTYDDGKKGKRP